MSWDRRIDLFVNVGATPEFVLLASKAVREPAERPVLVSGDVHKLRVWLLDASVPATPPEVLTLAVGEAMIFAGKARASATALLFSATGFVAVETGAGICYEATLDLTPAELRQAFGEDDSVLCVCDLEVQDAANTSRRTRQFAVRVRRGVYTNESDPTPAAPAYPAADALVLRGPADANFRFKDGNLFQLLNRTTGKFHTVFADGADGEETLDLGPGED